MQRQAPSQPKPSFLERFQNWAAILGAVLLTFFAHPFAFSGSVGVITEFGDRYYSLGWAMPFLWWLVTFFGMVTVAGVILKVLFTGGIISLVRRFT